MLNPMLNFTLSPAGRWGSPLHNHQSPARVLQQIAALISSARWHLRPWPFQLLFFRPLADDPAVLQEESKLEENVLTSELTCHLPCPSQWLQNQPSFAAWTRMSVTPSLLQPVTPICYCYLKKHFQCHILLQGLFSFIAKLVKELL